MGAQQRLLPVLEVLREGGRAADRLEGLAAAGGRLDDDDPLVAEDAGSARSSVSLGIRALLVVGRADRHGGREGGPELIEHAAHLRRQPLLGEPEA